MSAIRNTANHSAAARRACAGALLLLLPALIARAQSTAPAARAQTPTAESANDRRLRALRVEEARELAQEFRRIIRARDGGRLNEWFDRVAAGELTDFKNFAKGLREDEAAVRAAMTYEWSNGMTEGHINRLKTIKRQMYGRAKDDLLRARVLLAA